MKKLSSLEIRNIWLKFFESKNHEIIPSKSLIPINDDSLLWINSGIATLKDYFVGKKIPNNPRIVNSQKAIRTNDIENVGVTSRHHTFFEMLGNFSIGDYFRDEAIEFAFELLFKHFQFAQEKIYITYFVEDQATFLKWKSLGIKEDHLISGSHKTNFWDVGQGPCGPCTEIFYDRGEKFDSSKIGIELLKKDLENDRYIEIWNIVFSQFNNDGENHYEELKQKNIDTGAGLERLASIFQDTPTNFESDLFLPIILEIEKLTTAKYKIDNYFIKEPRQEKINKYFRIIADHIRASTLAINDGAIPSNHLRGYIIRRLIRRAYRFGILLGAKETTFLYKLVKVISSTLSWFEISIKNVETIIHDEEILFSKTIIQGEEILLKEINNVQNNEMNFEIAFKLFETYGFPVELTKEILEQKNIKLDISQFDIFKEKHANNSRGNKISGLEKQIQIIQEIKAKVSSFIGYDCLETEAEVIFVGKENNKYFVLLDKTPFYATSGGQNCDHGQINNIDVEDVFKDKYGNHWHVISQTIKEKRVLAKVDKTIRLAQERNHSATHLLNAALRRIFNDEIIQVGSDNNEKKLRFDFPLKHRPSDKQINEIEQMVNQFINNNYKRHYVETTIEKAKKTNAIFLTNENYDNVVRIVDFDISKEFCGGTHVKNTKEIQAFKIIKFESKGAGIFRIEGITSNSEIKKFIANEKEVLKTELENLIKKNQKLKTNYKLNIPNDIKFIQDAIIKAREDNKTLSKEPKIINLDSEVVFSTFDSKKAFINLDFQPLESIKSTAINLREKYPDSIIILASIKNEKMTLIVASKKYNSKNIFDQIALKHHGKGGGNFEFAMGIINKTEFL